MRKRYPTDLSEEEWSKIEGLFKTDPKKGGRPSKHSRKEIVDAIFTFLVQTVHGVYYLTIFLLGKLFIVPFSIGKI